MRSARGGKNVAFYTEFASDDPMRRGIAISRLAEVLKTAIDQLSETKYGKLLDANIYKKVKKEMETMRPWVTDLDLGKRPSGAMGRGLSSMPTPRESVDYERATKKLYAWLQEETSHFRACLSLLACGGVFYGASVAEKVARAAIHSKGGKLSEADFLSATAKRASESAKGGKDESMEKAEKDLFE